MFAVIKTGGKQYRVAAANEFTIERIPGEAGEVVSFKEVLMVGTTIGAPFVAGASVTAEIVAQTRGPKVISFKKRRRQNSKRTRGHRQDLTVIRIGEILADDAEQDTAKADVFAADLAVGAALAETGPDVVAMDALNSSPADETVAGETLARKSRPARKPKASEADADAGSPESA